MTETHCSIVVLISGAGSNLQALIDASMHANFKIVRVISNNPNAYGLQRAARDNIPTLVLDHRDYKDRKAFDQALQEVIDEINPQLIVLAGFMRILGDEFVHHFAGRVINIHPALLPKFPGTQTHERALAAGETEHGASVHFVTEDLDGGPIIARDRVPVHKDDTVDSLQARVLEKEHLLYPKVVSWFAAGRLAMKDGKAWLDGEPLPAMGVEVHP